MTKEEIIKSIDKIIETVPHNKITSEIYKLVESLEKEKVVNVNLADKGAVVYKRKKIYDEEYGRRFKKVVDAYFIFFETVNKRKPKFGEPEGKNVKKLMVYLKNISKSKTWEEAEQLANAIFTNWTKLSKWYIGKEDIKIIYGQINNIINELTKANAINSSSIEDIDNLIDKYL